MKIQRTHVYHTKLLIPDSIAKEAREQETEKGAIEVIMLWQEAHRAKHHFTRGDICYHVDDIHQKLNVDKIIRSFPKPRDGEPQKSKIDGIATHWHQEIP